MNNGQNSIAEAQRHVLSLPDKLVMIIDTVLAAAALWMIFPELIFRRAFDLPLLPGVHFSGWLSHRNLAFFCALLFFRMHVRRRSGLPGTLPVLAEAVSKGMLKALIWAFAFCVFMNATSERKWPSGDTIPAKLIPVSILEEGNLDLDEFVPGIQEGRRYCLLRKDGRFLSVYPAAAGITALPVYAAVRSLSPGLFSSWRLAYSVPGGDDTLNIVNEIERFSAAAIVALSAVVIFSIGLRVTKNMGDSLLITCAYAFGSSAISTASQALWQHTPALLFIALTVLLLMKAESGGAGYYYLAGLAGAWAFACRPTDIIFAAVMGLYVLVCRGFRPFVRYSAAFGLLAGAVLAFNYFSYGFLQGGYASQAHGVSSFSAEALAGLLISPSRGLFVFSPFLIAAVLMAPGGIRSDRTRMAFFLFLSAMLMTAVLSFWKYWPGGVSFGPRIMSEVMVLLVMTLPFSIAFIRQRRWLREFFLTAVIFSLLLNVIGTRHGDNSWSRLRYSDENNDTFWNIRDSQPLWTLKRADIMKEMDRARPGRDDEQDAEF